ncbi:MAG: hypothetical protein ACRENG_29720 [bacterium]
MEDRIGNAGQKHKENYKKYLADDASVNSVFPIAKLIANANERAEDDESWLIPLKNFFSAVWPLFLYVGLLLLLHAWLEKTDIVP